MWRQRAAVQEALNVIYPGPLYQVILIIGFNAFYKNLKTNSLERAYQVKEKTYALLTTRERSILIVEKGSEITFVRLE